MLGLWLLLWRGAAAADTDDTDARVSSFVSIAVVVGDSAPFLRLTQADVCISHLDAIAEMEDACAHEFRNASPTCGADLAPEYRSHVMTRQLVAAATDVTFALRVGASEYDVRADAGTEWVVDALCGHFARDVRFERSRVV